MKVLDIKIFDKNIPEAIKIIKEKIESKQKNNLLISATGAHGVITAKKNHNFKNILDNFFLNLPDGMPVVWLGKMKGAKTMERCYGPDFFKELISNTKSDTIRHFFCGGKEGVAEELKKVCEQKYNNYNIVGTYSPPFRKMTDGELENLAKDINSKNVDVVWVGLSTPNQEIFAHRLSKFTNVHCICTVGAAFDFNTGKVQQSPKFIQNIGMEWFFRLLMEPKRLYKRYLEIVPLFIIYNFIELLTGKFFINKGEVK